tara:strand:- start:253 stop:582 length:330 start_codon:yes stop_codon:yes gene_type:complete
MTLSKKNINKLKSITIDKLSDHSNKLNSKPKNLDAENPNDIFYSIIDNSNDIKETTLINKKLKESEERFFNSKSSNDKANDNITKKDLSIKLTEEDLLYDEFNYLLEEE